MKKLVFVFAVFTLMSIFACGHKTNESVSDMDSADVKDSDIAEPDISCFDSVPN